MTEDALPRYHPEGGHSTGVGRDITCVLCTHLVRLHNPISGCTECDCMATQGEARYNHYAPMVPAPIHYAKKAGQMTETVIAYEGVWTADGRLLEEGALAWSNPVVVMGPGGLVGEAKNFRRREDHAVVADLPNLAELNGLSISIAVDSVEAERESGALGIRFTKARVRTVHLGTGSVAWGLNYIAEEKPNEA